MAIVCHTDSINCRNIGGTRPLVKPGGVPASPTQIQKEGGAGVTTVTSIRGTFGYLSPEYLERGQASAKADVFAFGVVLLELMTGEGGEELFMDG